MKQNKFVQLIAILISALVQIGIFLLILTNLRTTEAVSFDISMSLPILHAYGLALLGICVIGSIIYGGYYIKKYKSSWMTYIRENILNSIHISIIIGYIIQVINLCVLTITCVLCAQSEELRPQLGLLIITAIFTGLFTLISGIILETCFYEKAQQYLINGKFKPKVK